MEQDNLKSTYGQGSIEVLPSGKCRLREWVEIDGVKKRKSFTGPSPKAARDAYKAFLASSQKKTVHQVQTVRQWAKYWLEVYKKPGVEWKVGKDYEMYVDRHIIPVIGDLRLADVRPANIAMLYANAKNRNKKPLSGSALNKLRITLNGIFETAIDNDLCIKNPAQKVPLPNREAVKVKVFTKSQMEYIIKALPNHPSGPALAFLLYTGLRVGELLSLMWTDIDAEKKEILVRRSLTRNEEGEIVGNHTKSRKDRIVPYDEALEPYLAQIPRFGLYVICRPDGHTHTHHSFDTVYYSFFDDLNAQLIKDKKDPLPRLTPHKCRHTFATYLLRGGVDIRVVQMILGHAHIQTTEIYTQVDVEDIKNNISKLAY